MVLLLLIMCSLRRPTCLVLIVSVYRLVSALMILLRNCRWTLMLLCLRRLLIRRLVLVISVLQVARVLTLLLRVRMGCLCGRPCRLLLLLKLISRVVSSLLISRLRLMSLLILLILRLLVFRNMITLMRLVRRRLIIFSRGCRRIWMIRLARSAWKILLLSRLVVCLLKSPTMSRFTCRLLLRILLNGLKIMRVGSYMKVRLRLRLLRMRSVICRS